MGDVQIGDHMDSRKFSSIKIVKRKDGVGEAQEANRPKREGAQP